MKGGFQDGELTTGSKPFNVFARVGAGVMKQGPQNIGTPQEWLGTEKENEKIPEELR